jgi:hypothetical protein
MRTLPAAAVQKGDVVKVNDAEVRVIRVHNGEPVAGRITWDTDKEPVEIGGAVRVEVVRLA